MLQRLRRYGRTFPRQVWVLVAGTFVNALGSGLVFPFLTLYLRQRMGVSLVQIGFVFTLNSATSLAAGMVGGLLADRVGRRLVMLASLVATAVVLFLMGVATTFIQVAALAAALGLTSPIFGPARDAMLADLTQPDQRAEAYSVLRVASNMGFAVGPAIGGFLAATSYFLSFSFAALGSLIFFVLTLTLVKETRPAAASEDKASVPLAGFGPVLRDRVFMTFIGMFVLTSIVYSQITTNLPVYMKESFGLGEQYFGWVMTTNAAMVVVFQMWVTRKVAPWKRLTAMAVGAVLYAVGVGAISGITFFAGFILCATVYTVGEMIVAPVATAFVADLSPADMRGRYMGVLSLTWGASYGIGPALGGAIYDAGFRQQLWLMSGALGLVAAAGFLLLQRRTRTAHVVEPADDA
jgi:MFS family permease